MLFTDQMNRTVEVNFPPGRIISLVPSQTELLYDLGLDENVTGITKFCIHPPAWFKGKPKVGGTKKINLKVISELRPDLVIGNKEENEKQQIEELMKHFPVWMSDIKSLEDAITMITSIGKLTGRSEKSAEIAMEISGRFNQFGYNLRKIKFSRRNAVYFIWKKPYIAAGKNTFINAMIERCGLKNAIRHSTARYPAVSAEELQRIDPEIIFLSSEPYPFRAGHIAGFQKICPGAKIIPVDGKIFSWYGSHLLKAPDYFLKVIKTIV